MLVSKKESRADTPWSAAPKLDSGVRPEWRALYKPPLAKRVGDLQWRILHGAVAVNAFVSVINTNVSQECPFCYQRETVFFIVFKVTTFVLHVARFIWCFQ